MFRLAHRNVTTPSGTEWRIGRRWMSRSGPRWRRVRVGADERAVAAEGASWSLPDVGGLDELAVALAVFVGVLVVAVVLIPLLLFGIELIIAGFVVALGILGRGLLGRPWVVQAVPSDGGQVRTWEVSGWRRSGRLIDEVAASLAAGLEPAPAEGVAQISPPPMV